MVFATGKPRPGVIVQADDLRTPVDILVCPFTTTLLDTSLYRITVQPTPGNGLKSASALMVDKIGPVPLDRLSEAIGRLSENDQLRLDIALAAILDLGTV